MGNHLNKKSVYVNKCFYYCDTRFSLLPFKVPACGNRKKASNLVLLFSVDSARRSTQI
nr:MAG TPA: hypothetical protein [Caudoviricetes sp.]